MTESKYSLRLVDIRSAEDDVSITDDQLRREAGKLAGLQKVDKLVITLARQGVDCINGTISYQQKQDSKKALATWKENATTGGSALQWDDLDTNFLDLTIVSSPENAELDICAIHGLNGNAFDTWRAENGKIWLRDFLPRDIEFEKARIMTFGYTSGLCDGRKANDRLVDYADTLLRELQLIRKDDPKCPLILVCHSMGGLVARLAMVRLHSRPTTYYGLTPSQCGLLFLSTPHYGSRIADWSNFWIRLGGAVGVRDEIVKDLQTLNISVVDDMQIWEDMIEKSVVACYCEADNTITKVASIIQKSSLIVSEASAGFLKSAVKVVGTNHRTICRFESSRRKPYTWIREDLLKMWDELKMRREQHQILDPIRNNLDQVLPPYLPPLAPSRSPLPAGKKYYCIGNNGIRSSDVLVGRTDILDQVKNFFESAEDTSSTRKLLCLSGIGGIGKTEISYRVAEEFKDLRNIFMFDSSTPENLQQSYAALMSIIGHDSLTHKYPQYQEARKIWESRDYEGQIDAIKQWSGSAENADSVVIFDDLDGINDISTIQKAIPPNVHGFIYSCRNPTFHESNLLRAKNLSILQMSESDAETLLRKGCSCVQGTTDEKLELIANITFRHPLMMKASMDYMKSILRHECTSGDDQETVDTFLNLATSGDYDFWKDLLNQEIPGSLSLMQCFEKSLDRVPSEQLQSVLQLLDLLTLISPQHNDTSDCHFSKFFRNRPWLSSYNDGGGIPDINLLQSGLRGKGRILSMMEKVSLLVSNPQTQQTHIHPIWRHCARHRLEPARRLEWLHELLLICYHQSTVEEYFETTDLFFENILENVKVFSISLESLISDQIMKEWIEAKISETQTDRMVA